MTLKTLFRALLLGFVVVSLGVALADVAGLFPPPAPLAAPAEGPKGEWVAYYFHSSHRCPTCRGIEANTRVAVANQTVARSLELHVLDYEEPANRRFVERFGLAFPSVILAQVQEGSTVRWKNLDRVWELWEDRPAFVSYVQAELAKFKEGRP